MSEENLNAPQEPVAAESAAPEAVAPEAAPAPVEAPTLEGLLSEDLRSEANLKDFKDVNSLAKSYLNAQAMIGSSVRIPSEDASDEAKAEFLNKIKDVPGIILEPKTDEDKAEFYNRLGRPESAEAYSLEELVTNELADVPHIGDELADFKAIAHEAGLTDAQAKALVSKRMDTLKSMQEQQLLRQEETQAELKKVWGTDYDNRLNAAKSVAKIYQEKYPDQMNELINGPAGNNAAFLNMLSEMAVMFKEQGHAGVSSTNFGMTPAQAQAKIAEKRADVGFMKAYTDEMHPGHNKAVADLNKLYQLAQG